MTFLASLRRYLPSAPGANRRRLEELAEELRQVRTESRRAQDRLADAIVPLARVSEHFPLLRRELDEFVQSLSVTLRQASERIREVDERLDVLMEHTRSQSDALGLLHSNLSRDVHDGTEVALGRRTVTSTTKDVTEQVESLRSAVDRLAVGAARTETLIEELLDRPQPDRDQTTWHIALLACGFAGLAIALSMLAYLG
jgi:chromosome segregation ATPase